MSSRKDTLKLSRKIRVATGSDKELDKCIGQILAIEVAEFTGSIEHAKSVLKMLLPDAELHVGYGATGIFPCATVATAGHLYTNEAPTVPIAILRACFSASVEQAQSQTDD